MKAKLTNNWLRGAILLLSILVSCADDKEKKTIVCWGDSLTASHTNVGGNSIKQLLKETFMGGKFSIEVQKFEGFQAL